MLAESGQRGPGTCHGLFRVREAPGRASGQPLTARLRGQPGPAGGGEVRELRGGNACGAPAPAAREEAAAERSALPALLRGRSRGHSPYGPAPGGVPGQSLEPDGAAGRAPLPATRTGRRPLGPTRRWVRRAPLGPRTLAWVEGKERSWGAQVPPVNTVAGQNTSDGSTPRLSHCGIKAKPGLLPPSPCGLGPRRCRAGACSKAHRWLCLKGAESREGRRGRGGAAGVRAPLPRSGAS